MYCFSALVVSPGVSAVSGRHDLPSDARTFSLTSFDT